MWEGLPNVGGADMTMDCYKKIGDSYSLGLGES